MSAETGSVRNVVVIMSDQHRRDAAGCYGHAIAQTPSLDRLAAEGVRFTNAYCPSPICGPCRSAVVTGRHLHRISAITHGHMREDMGLPTLGTVFRDAGFVTGAFGKLHAAGEDDNNDLGFAERALRIYTPTSNDYQHTIGLDSFWEYCSYLPRYRPDSEPPPRNTYNPGNAPINLPDELIFDSMVADRSIDFMNRHREEPFCLWVGFEKPHPELYAPQRFHDMYNPADMPLPESIWDSRDDLPDTIRDNPTFPIVTRDAYTDDELRGIVAAYYANVTYMDEQIGRVLDALDSLGLADDTLVIYTSDHGENLLEHGLVHKQCFFECAAAVPLVVRMPGIADHCGVHDGPVSLIDLFPTVTEACGVDPPSDIDGASLLPALRENVGIHTEVFSEFYEYGTAERMIRIGKLKYVHSEGDTHQLYNLEDDPDERVNLAADPAHAALCRELDERVCRDWVMPDMASVRKVRGDDRPGQKHSAMMPDGSPR